MKKLILLTATIFGLFGCASPQSPESKSPEIEKEVVESNILNDFASLQGVWISSDDKNSKIEFVGNQKIDFYEEEKISEGSFELKNTENGQYLDVTTGGELFEYNIMNLSETALDLMYLPRGNVLKYTR